MTLPRTILMTADCVGGVWTYVLELIRALDRYGVRLALATFGRKLSSAQAREAAMLANAEVRESVFKLEWMSDPWSDIEQASEWLMTVQDEFRPEIVHLNHYAHGCLPWRVPVMIVGHSCVLSWWRAVKGGPIPKAWRRYAELVRDGLRAADVVVAPSEFMLSELQAFYGPLATTAIVPNGRSLPLLPPVRKEPFIFASGRLWDEAKNIQTLCNIAPEWKWPVYVAGEMGDGACLEHVVRLGQLSSAEMLPYLSRASIYALPARYEPFGLSILEAALCGCALVLGDTPSLRQIWDGAAIFVSSNDPAEVRKAVKQLIENDALRSELALAARRKAAYYTPERLAASYVKLYQSLVSETAEASCVS